MPFLKGDSGKRIFWAKSRSVAVCIPEKSPWWLGMVVEIGEGGWMGGDMFWR